ncbi:MAG: hypothetical protein WBO06_09400, partial [Gammaproteobacteria bacterium]
GTGMVQAWEITEPYPALELFALDYGPGIAHLPAAMEDGYTTARTMGKGLGAIRRLAHRSEFYTLPASVAPDSPWHGMSVWARFYLSTPIKDPRYEIGSFLRAYQDDRHNGDCISMKLEGNSLKWLHMDGLGHGKSAYDATVGTAEIMQEGSTPMHTMETLSGSMKGTRGAVAIAAELDLETSSGTLCGVGDMAAYMVCNGQRRSISFAPGVLGHEHRSLEALPLNFPPQSLLMTASDGIRRSWNLDTFPGLWRLHPQLIALFLGNTAGRGNDDKSLFVIRTTPTRGNE